MSPQPSHEELAAIVAAFEMVWPQPVLVVERAIEPNPGGWRFSGRWWSRPALARRERPWLNTAR